MLHGKYLDNFKLLWRHVANFIFEYFLVGLVTRGIVLEYFSLEVYTARQLGNQLVIM